MRYNIQILRAMLRLARQRKGADAESLLDRVGGTREQMRFALRRLEAEGVVERLGDAQARLTLAGFAVAVAMVKLESGKRASRRAQTKAA